MDTCAIGTVVRAHGVHGEVKVTPYGPLSDIMFVANVRKIYLVHADKARGYDVVSVKFLTDAAVIKLSGIDSPEAAALVIGDTVSVAGGDNPPLPDGSYRVEDLIGMTVLDGDGAVLGTVTGIIRTKSNDVFEVASAKGTVNVPFVNAVVTNVDPGAKRMTVIAPELFA